MSDEVKWYSGQVLVPTVVLTGGFLGGFYVYRSYLRRIPNSTKMPDAFFRRRSMLGRVVSVGDADNFHFYHTPGGVFGGWGWLRHAPAVNQRKLAGHTIHVRLCGVDAPEGAHFGKPAQPYASDALEWLRRYCLGRRVRILPLARDQYSRTVAEAKIWTWTGRKNISAEMLRNGWAVVYESKTGSEFNGNEDWFRQLEANSKKKRVGMFRSRNLETPGEYKKRTK